jgi:hypothetical protein
MSDSNVGIVVFDFVTRFPHKFWVSSWAKDDQYPDGFRYKLISVRPEPDGLIELLVLLEEKSGDKTEMTSLEVSPSALDRTANTFTEGLAEEYALEFEELDLSNTRSEQQFHAKVVEAGWHHWLVQ